LDDLNSDIFGGHVIQLRNFLAQTFESANKLLTYSTDLISDNKLPNILISENIHDHEIVKIAEDGAIITSNVFALNLAEIIGKNNHILSNLQNKVKIGDEILPLPSADLCVKDKKIIDNSDIKTFDIQIMSVNTHNDLFLFKKKSVGKTFSGKYRGRRIGDFC
jgi:hypothetical protein